MLLPKSKFFKKIYILPEDLSVCLLGQSFLEETEAQIDYKESRLKLNGEYFFLDKEVSEWNATPDRELTEKAYSITQTKSLSTQEEELMQEKARN